jgi:hypothetical protein
MTSDGAVEKFGRVDTLVNNAEIFIGKRKLVLTRSASTTTTGAALHLRFSGRAVSEQINGKISRMIADLPTKYLYSLFTHE